MVTNADLAAQSTSAAGSPSATGDTTPSSASAAGPIDAARTVSLSSFTRAPGSVLPLLETGPVLLTRRQGEAIVLSLATESTPTPTESASKPSPTAADPDVDLATLLNQLLPAVSAQQLAQSLGGSLPWMADLPPAARRAMVDEVIATTGHCVREGLIPALRQWQAVAGRFTKTQ